jgi:uncharacterized protein YbbC (DUF1343 family)
MIVFNYIENSHFNIPVYFLYSETPIPADDILEGIDHIFIGLQEMGCRMDTYNYTLSLLLYKCIDKNTEIIALDRPKPLNEIDIEGHILNIFENDEDIDIDTEYFGLTEEKEEIIQRAIKKVGTEFLRPIRDEVGKNITYAQIKLCMLIMKFEEEQ